ncbi:MAG TPA: RecX family transcriptional regulator [Oceanospirillaceae bacterium]|nr:RecX family transcriptional regulator [Oceanospirillaceae bacterium]
MFETTDVFSPSDSELVSPANSELAKLRIQARDKAIGLLARREHSRFELKHKLSRFQDDLDVDALIDDLVALDVQSDRRYAGMLVRSKAMSGYGLARINQWARQNGVANDDLYLAVEELDHDWFAAALLQRQKHFGCSPPASLQEKVKQMRYLYNRGFNQDQIHYALDAEQQD